jgi:magnesium chelatase family protein
VFIIPRANLEELQYVPGIVLYDFAHFQELLSFLDTKERKKAIKGGSLNYQKLAMRGEGKTDFADIKGQERTKRALTIAAAGMHNVLMSGPPGSGKSLLAKATASILPPMSFEEVLEVSQIYSVVGELHSDQPLIVSRPFRAVHHTASKVSIV